MSKPAKPWQWSCLVLPAPDSTVWVRLEPWSPPFQCQFRSEDYNFFTVVATIDGSANVGFLLTPQQALQWRAL